MIETIKVTAEFLASIVKEFPYMNEYLYTDVRPMEIVKVTGNTIHYRNMETSENKVKMEWVSGGFAGHCTNNYEQRYEYFSNPDNPIHKRRITKLIMLSGNNGISGWQLLGGSIRLRLERKPLKFHDYNF